MRYAAVVFDLFGTLIDEGGDAYLAMMRQTAGLLDAPLDRLYAATAADAEARTVGAYESVEQQFYVLYERLRVAPDAERRAATVRAYMDAQRSRLVPRDGVLDTLRRLGELGLKRGLISNASQAIIDLWPHTAFPPYFENATISAAVKTAKPGPAIYRMCCESLDVAPEDCLYVGDGGSDELPALRESACTPCLSRRATTTQRPSATLAKRGTATRSRQSGTYCASWGVGISEQASTRPRWIPVSSTRIAERGAHSRQSLMWACPHHNRRK